MITDFFISTCARYIVGCKWAGAGDARAHILFLRCIFRNTSPRSTPGALFSLTTQK